MASVILVRSKFAQSKLVLFTIAVFLLLCATAFAIDTKDKQLAALDAVLVELDTHYGMIKYKAKILGVNYADLRKKYQKMIDDAVLPEEAAGLAPRKPAGQTLETRQFSVEVPGMDNPYELHRRRP